MSATTASPAGHDVLLHDALIAARGHVVGADVPAPLLRRARERTASEKRRNVAYVEADVEVYPFPPAGFDAFVCPRAAALRGCQS
ncbi:class I SAM-dependent methyltransferase [Streptomyces sp. CA-249302]|uniref:class I SAM-dependent methyltransferase n=1 Tax=Streptomyces sp. CA-249302 TaxID=3240058 RepID=UPI003D8CFD27